MVQAPSALLIPPLRSSLPPTINMATNDQIPTQTPPQVVVPRLNIPEPPTQQLTASRYTTPVSVEFCIYGEVRHIKWFSDIQMAWIWIRAQVDRCDYREDWEVTPFLETADEMDRQWAQGDGEDGSMVADDDGYEYVAYYRPHVQYEDVRDREEHF